MCGGGGGPPTVRVSDTRPVLFLLAGAYGGNGGATAEPSDRAWIRVCEEA